VKGIIFNESAVSTPKCKIADVSDCSEKNINERRMWAVQVVDGSQWSAMALNFVSVLKSTALL
jgi:hypothetical protein